MPKLSPSKSRQVRSSNHFLSCRVNSSTLITSNLFTSPPFVKSFPITSRQSSSLVLSERVSSSNHFKSDQITSSGQVCSCHLDSDRFVKSGHQIESSLINSLPQVGSVRVNSHRILGSFHVTSIRVKSSNQINSDLVISVRVGEKGSGGVRYFCRALASPTPSLTLTRHKGLNKSSASLFLGELCQRLRSV